MAVDPSSSLLSPKNELYAVYHKDSIQLDVTVGMLYKVSIVDLHTYSNGV